MIANPDYKGPWEAKKIPNPKYEADDNLYLYKDFSFIGFDLWQVKAGSIFDDIIITDDAAEADKFAEKWKALNDKEKELKKQAEDSKAAEEKKDDAKDEDDDDAGDEEA